MTAARSIRSLLLALTVALALVATAQPARAAGQLTTAQINAVINLLQAFDVPQATINTVKSVLGGGTGTTNGGTDTNTGNETADNKLSATPISGAAPLVVSFNTSASSQNGTVRINFGDGSESVFEKGLTHTYTKKGTYTAKLKQGGKTIGRQTITVSEQTSGGTSGVTFTATPTSGNLPLAVAFTARNVFSIDFGDGQSKAAPLFFCGESQGCNTTWNATHTYTGVGTYTAKALNGSVVLATKTITVSTVIVNNCQSNRNDNSSTASCSNDQDEDSNEDGEEDNSSSDPVYTVPTVVVTYPKNSKGPYDITRDGHFGTNMLIEWRNYKMPAGSYACSYLYNGSSGTSYPIPETNNCLNIGTNNQYSSNRGYARVPAGNKYQARVVAYSTSGAVIAQDLSDAVFSMQVMDRNSQEKKVARDTIVTDSAGKITFGGSATIGKIYITIMKDLATLYDSPAITVTSGRWSHTTTRAFTQGTYSIAILDEDGNVLDSGFVYVNPSAPHDSTGGVSVTEASLVVSTTANSLWVDVKGSTGNGCDGKSYTLDYGDGTNATILMGAGSSCQPIFTRSYPYKTAGTYTIKLLPSCPSAAVCASPTPIVTKTVTVPGTTSFMPKSDMLAALPYLPMSLYETMSKVTDALAAVEMAPIYVLTDALSEFLYQTGLY